MKLAQSIDSELFFEIYKGLPSAELYAKTGREYCIVSYMVEDAKSALSYSTAKPDIDVKANHLEFKAYRLEHSGAFGWKLNHKLILNPPSVG